VYSKRQAGSGIDGIDRVKIEAEQISAEKEKEKKDQPERG
jgi:hypothetical protein